MGFFLLFLCCCGESLVLVYCLCCCCGHYLHISEAFLIASYLSASVVLCKSDRGWTKTQLAASYIDNAARQDGIRPWNVTKTREKERSKKKESVYGTKPTTQGPLPNAAISKKHSDEETPTRTSRAAAAAAALEFWPHKDAHCIYARICVCVLSSPAFVSIIITLIKLKWYKSWAACRSFSWTCAEAFFFRWVNLFIRAVCTVAYSGVCEEHDKLNNRGVYELRDGNKKKYN